MMPRNYANVSLVVVGPTVNRAEVFVKTPLHVFKKKTYVEEEHVVVPDIVYT